MSIKGFPTTQKLINSNNNSRNDFVTVEPTDGGLRQALDVMSRSVFRVGSDTVARTAGAGTGNVIGDNCTSVVDTATPAKVGDFVRFENGNAAQMELPIIDVSINSFKIGAKLQTPPASGDTFFILRPTTLKVGSDGSLSLSASSGPVQFVKNGANQNVTEDTVTPANSNPLPVGPMNTSGALINPATSDLQTAQQTLIGAVTETAPATDTASSGLNGRLQRVAQRLTSLIGLLPGSLGQKTSAASLAVVLPSDQTVPVSGTFFQATQPISATSLPLPTGAATETTLAAQSAKLPATLGTKAAASSMSVTWATENEAEIGAVTETAPASDTASSGLNGRLQRIAQRLTSLIGLLPTSLGQKTMANGLAVTVASDQSAIPSSQSGIWTVQPGNTANTTAWLVKQETASTGTVTSVTSVATTTSLLASNTSRKGATFFNESTSILYLKLGATASLTSYTVQIPPSGYYEIPGPKFYTGAIDGIWSSANGAVRITELT